MQTYLPVALFAFLIVQPLSNRGESRLLIKITQDFVSLIFRTLRSKSYFKIQLSAKELRRH